MFSMFPLFPAIAALIRSVTGVDELDYTPLVVAISVFCMYLIVFRRNYVNLIPQSMESALEQTESALVVYDTGSGGITYKNRAAEVYAEYLPEILQNAGKPGDVREETVGPAVLRIRVSDFGDGASRLVTMTDVTSLTEQHRRLEEEIIQRDEAVNELEDKRRNIDAYLEALYQIPDLKEKQVLFDGTKEETVRAFATMQSNMDRAAGDIAECEPLLNETIEISEKTLASVRKAVAKMKEGSV